MAAQKMAKLARLKWAVFSRDSYIYWAFRFLDSVSNQIITSFWYNRNSKSFVLLFETHVLLLLISIFDIDFNISTYM